MVTGALSLECEVALRCSLNTRSQQSQLEVGFLENFLVLVATCLSTIGPNNWTNYVLV